MRVLSNCNATESISNDNLDLLWASSQYSLCRAWCLQLKYFNCIGLFDASSRIVVKLYLTSLFSIDPEISGQLHGAVDTLGNVHKGAISEDR